MTVSEGIFDRTVSIAVLRSKLKLRSEDEERKFNEDPRKEYSSKRSSAPGKHPGVEETEVL